MNFRSLTTIFTLLLCCSLGAQTTAEKAADRAKNRTERRAQNKVDNKVDQAVDEAFDSIGNLFKKKKTSEPASTPNGEANEQMTDEEAEAQSMRMLGGLLGGGGDWEPFTNELTFSLTMTMEETKKNGKVDNSNVRIGVTTDRFAIITSNSDEQASSQMILNTQDGMTTMVTTTKDGEKSGFRLRLPTLGRTMTEVGEETLDRFTFRKTGERQTIDGYNCEKVIVTDTEEGTVTESWITQDLKITATDIFGGMTRAFGGKAPQAKGGASEVPFEGFPIMSTTTDNGKTYVTRFRDIKIGEANMDRSLLDTSGVEIQSIGGF
jgi:hypothetical protein